MTSSHVQPSNDDDNDPRSAVPESQRRIAELPREYNQQQKTAMSTDEAFLRETLQVHNKYRALHQAPPLKLDSSLTASAQEWAETMAKRGRLEPDVNSKMANSGENLAMKYHSDMPEFSGTEVTDYWYSGIVDFDFEECSPKLKSGSAVLSFTQLVWKASELVGFGRAKSRRGKVYVVGRYYPSGNLVESYTDNVLLPQDSKLKRESMEHPSRSSIEPQPRSSHLSEFTEPTSSRLNESAEPTSSRQSESAEPTSSRQSESTEPRRFRVNEPTERPPVIGPMRPGDKLVSINESTAVEKDRTVVTIQEKYTTKNGGTYTRQRTMTYFGVHYGGH